MRLNFAKVVNPMGRTVRAHDRRGRERRNCISCNSEVIFCLTEIVMSMATGFFCWPGFFCWYGGDHVSPIPSLHWCRPLAHAARTHAQAHRRQEGEVLRKRYKYNWSFLKATHGSAYMKLYLDSR